MEVKDVKIILDDILSANDHIDKFNTFFEEYRSYEHFIPSDKVHALWKFMWDNNYIPQDLNSDDDMKVVSILSMAATKENEPIAMKYALILLHQRFMLGDMLEKAFVSRKLLKLFFVCHEMIESIISEFIENARYDKLYAMNFDENDWSVENMWYELVLAFVPAIEWLDKQWSNSDNDELEEIMKELSPLYKKRSNMSDKSPLLPKFSAFGQYLYENVSQRVELSDEKKAALAQIVSSLLASEAIQTATPESKKEHIAVDMGVSVRWATLNIGAKEIEDNGDYFAWGETQTKDQSLFTKNGYLLGEPTFRMKIYRYNDKDRLETLLPEDDAAVQQWGDGWRMPTKEEMEELCANCSIKEIEHNGKQLLQFTSNINQHVIYFPKNGYIKNGKLKDSSDWFSVVELWTATSCVPIENEAQYLTTSGSKIWIFGGSRWYGRGIRPVKP